MVNELDEVTGETNPGGRDVNVIDKQLKIQVGWGTKVFEASIWILGFPLAYLIGLLISDDTQVALLSLIFGVVPGLVFQLLKVLARAFLQKLQQKVQADASQIDNYLEQRVIILQNLAGLIAQSIDLDKDVMKTVAAYRSGINPAGSDLMRNQASSNLDGAFLKINVAFENYPELKAQENIGEAMRQNAYLQKEITAARTLYNDTVTRWNQEIYSWPVNQIVAAKAGYTTRIPFTASQETKDAARATFF